MGFVAVGGFSRLAPDPAVAGAVRYDGSPLLRERRNSALLAIFLILVVAVTLLALRDSVRAEWSLALGNARRVEATVTGSQPSNQVNRTCTLTQINVRWPRGGAGNFTVCDEDAGQLPAGTSVTVYATPGDPAVIQGEGRAGAITGVSLESLFGLLLLLAIVALAWTWLQLTMAGRRWRHGPWLPGVVRPAAERSARTRRLPGAPAVVFLDSEALPWPAGTDYARTCLAQVVSSPSHEQAERQGLELHAGPANLRVLPRQDGTALAAGDRVWLVPAGRTLTGRRSAPYAVIRSSDRSLFWARGRRMPGRW
jgi:hypothetical protein